MSRRAAVSAAQQVLINHGARIRADGVWGPKTDGAYVAAPVVVKDIAERAVSDLGFSITALRGPIRAERWVSSAEVAGYISEATAKVGVPEAWLFYILEREPRIRIRDGVKEYDAMSIAPSGAYRGLMQMGGPAWADAQQVLPEIGSYSNWRDPRLNVLAAAAFAKRNMGYAQSIYRYRGPMTPALVYAMHNQGHTFISSARNGGMGRYANGQSAEARQTLVAAAQTVRSA